MDLSSISATRNTLYADASTPAFSAGAASWLQNPLLRSMPMALLLTDQPGRCIGANPCALRLLARPHDVVVGRHIRAFFPDAVRLKWHEAPDSPSSVRQIGEARLRREPATDLRVALSVATLPTSERPVTAYFFRDLSDELGTIAQLKATARIDPLTGLPNRMALAETIDRTLRGIARGAPPAALCYLDLDNFKVVNDTCGHMAGDTVLQMVAQVMQQRLRATDAIGRLGGDEFALLLRNCQYDDAVHYVEALRQKIAARKMNFLGREFNIGVSAGITLLTNKTPSVTVALIEADRACYRAKSASRAKRQLSPNKRLMAVLRPRRKA